MERIPDSVSESDVRDEANRRASKYGYCTKNGDPTYRTKIINNGFGKSKLNVWPRDKHGNLID